MSTDSFDYHDWQRKMESLVRIIAPDVEVNREFHIVRCPNGFGWVVEYAGRDAEFPYASSRPLAAMNALKEMVKRAKAAKQRREYVEAEARKVADYLRTSLVDLLKT